MICGAGLCSMHVTGGVTRGGHMLCVHIVISIQNTTVKFMEGGCREGSVA